MYYCYHYYYMYYCYHYYYYIDFSYPPLLLPTTTYCYQYYYYDDYYYYYYYFLFGSFGTPELGHHRRCKCCGSPLGEKSLGAVRRIRAT